MGKYERLKTKKKSIHDSIQESCDEMGTLSRECDRVADVAHNASIIIQNIDKDFENATKLSGVDMQFLFVAVALQCIRQYVISTFTQRTDHDESDEFAHKVQQKLFESDNDSKGIKIYRENGARYRATTEEIMNSFSVPYDVTNGTKKFAVGGHNELGNAIGLSGTTHRYKTLGHDPLFGWVFGTANIMTNTLTNNEWLTFHVKNSQVVSSGGIDKTWKMLQHVKARSLEKPTDLGLCVIKQGLHIASDMYSKEGIPIPGTVGINAELAAKLSSYGIDLGNVVKASSQAGFALLINQIIAMVHGLLYDESLEMGWKLYSVKTRKILMYSNCIASASNVIAVACGAIAGVYTGNTELTKKSLNYLDLGGLLVTIHRITSDSKFIYEVKKEFLANAWYDIVMNG